jgi:endonuclease YncB( thermonuclease family)
MRSNILFLKALRRIGFFALLLSFVIVWAYPELLGLVDSRAPAQTAEGHDIKIKDGDTISIAGQDYRLHGIDAPEFAQICQDAIGSDWRCGKEAHVALTSLIKRHTIACDAKARDKFQRIVATCRDEAGRDLARAMVEQGMAVSFGGFAEGPYADDERAAKVAKRGVWQGIFDTPSSWRSAHARGA